MEKIETHQLNLDPSVIEEFADYLSANEDATAVMGVSFVAHNSNNDSTTPNGSPA